ncbi:peroxiredoxin [Glacieibacterium frigidum]|uniref:thioredoxin-dependent peroxiredoxin n=1 Tax=Glacieibacterium frigidum TaxID=2593303 RepID=A0A552U951_9SPHN|nr:peroxiredoxin [Glacieibacterium frigidum]TRW14738.1 peroxiredoxin [Glacieibacterium frigidum]
MTIDSGDTAPALDLATDAGAPTDITGRVSVVYFYPKDDTSGCTREGIDFTALGDDFAAAGVQVIGVSKDSVASHAKFRAKHSLGVILAADPDGVACEAWGVWVEKSMYGRKYMGIERATFLVGKDGKVARAWHKVKVPGHAAEVLAAARALG